MEGHPLRSTNPIQPSDLMPERIYTEYPAVYDDIQSEWDYDRDVEFVAEFLGRFEEDGRRLLEIGCGTGEHTRRFLDRGFHVTAVDKYDGMLDRARTKCDADFRQEALPAMQLGEEFDVVVAIRGVINHLPPDALSDALEAIHAHVVSGGVVVFDNSSLPADGNDPALDVGETERGRYARVAHHFPTENGRLDWREVTFTPDGECIVNSRRMTPFDDETVGTALVETGFEVETHNGFGPDDHRTVFVGVA